MNAEDSQSNLLTMKEEPVYYQLARAIGPRIPNCMRKIRHCGDVYSAESETKLLMKSYCQTDWYSCGPVAAWSVIETFHPDAEFAAFYRDCRPLPTEGTTENKLVTSLRKHGVGVSVRRDLNFAKIADSIETGYPIITGIGCDENGEGDHWVVIYGVSRKPKRVFVSNIVRMLNPLNSRAEYTWREWCDEWNPKGDGLVCWGK